MNSAQWPRIRDRSPGAAQHEPGIPGARVQHLDLRPCRFRIRTTPAVNFITTIICLRAPGMTMFRMPIFTWTVLGHVAAGDLVFPILAAALFALGGDWRFGMHIFDPDNNGAMLWQTCSGFGHPEVYIIALPFFGIISEVLPVFSRKPIFGYKTLVFATIAIAALSASVWAHHMYATGQVLLPFFSSS